MTTSATPSAQEVLAVIRDAWGSWAEDKTELFEDWLFTDQPIVEAARKRHRGPDGRFKRHHGEE